MTRLDWSRDSRDWPHAASSRFIAAGGVRFHVQRMGTGPVALLLHGTGASTHSFRALMPPLAARFDVIAPDLPGHGFSSRAADPSLPGMAASLAALLGALDARPALVVGHSAGAAIGLRMALDGRIAPAHIVSLCGALQPFPGAAAALFPAFARLLFANPFVPELFAAGARLGGDVDGFLARSTGSTLDRQGLLLYARLLGDSGHVGGALRMMAAWDLAPLDRDLPKLGTPLLLLHGERDTAVPPDGSLRVAARVAGARAEIVASAGHLLHEEKPDATAARILEFTGSANAGAGGGEG